MGWFTKKNKSELGIAIEKLANSPSVENQKNFARFIKMTCIFFQQGI